MNSKQITEAAENLSRQATELSKSVKRVQLIEVGVVEKMQDVIEVLTHAILEICEEFDEEEAQGFRRPGRKQPAPLYDTLEEKKQALEGP